MKILLLIAFILTFPLRSNAQENLKEYNPVNTFSPDLSTKTENEIKRQYELLEKKNLTENEKLDLDILLKKYGEVVESVWDIINMECNWYCGGGSYKVTSSSSLDSTKNNKYFAKQANDLDYRTAWVEGKEDSGIGEYIEYYFKNNSPRITSIIISNGYFKSDNAWQNNNRVKALKLHINNVPTAILHLKDSKTDQAFEIDTLGRNEDGTELILKFEILEIYKGLKYDDTAITEIYFDGIDVH
ncbi:MAG: NADase-type glycan-binding domain-containing protein [Chitinophagales bacterium]